MTEFQLGDLVEFITTDHEYGITTLKIKEGDTTNIYKTGHTKMNAPAMVIIEIVLVDSKAIFDAKTGKRLKDKKSIHCQWFSHQTNSYHTRWFNSGVLNKIESIKTSLEEFKINQIVILKTAATKNINYENILKHKLLNEQGGINYELSQIYDSYVFLPPKMVVISSELKPNDVAKFDPKTGAPKRLFDTLAYKCMWYDYKTGKYSENHFTQSSLVALNKLSKNLLIDQFMLFDSESE